MLRVTNVDEVVIAKDLATGKEREIKDGTFLIVPGGKVVRCIHNFAAPAEGTVIASVADGKVECELVDYNGLKDIEATRRKVKALSENVVVVRGGKTYALTETDAYLIVNTVLKYSSIVDDEPEQDVVEFFNNDAFRADEDFLSDVRTIVSILYGFEAGMTAYAAVLNGLRITAGFEDSVIQISIDGVEPNSLYLEYKLANGGFSDNVDIPAEEEPIDDMEDTSVEEENEDEVPGDDDLGLGDLSEEDMAALNSLANEEPDDMEG